MKHTITLNKLNLDISYSLKDNSDKGYKTVSGHDLKIGDKIVIDNYFTEIIEEPTEEPTTTEKIITFFEENEDIFNDCIEELDSYNGYLNDDRYYEMEMLNDFYNGTEPLELLRRVYFGHDDDTHHTDEYERREYGEFNPNRDYFRFNGYGNLVSTDYKDYSANLDDYCIETMNENRSEIYTIEEHEELKALFDELEREE